MRKLLVIVLALWAAWGHSAEPEADEVLAPDWLVSDQPVEYQLVAGDTHRYAFHLRAGQFLGIEVEQRGIDVVLDIFGPDGERVANFDSPTQNQSSEIAFVVAESAGAYELKVTTAYLERERGHYLIRRRELRQATARDHHRSHFQKLWLEAKSLGRANSTPEEWQRALTLYGDMIHHARLADDLVGEAWAWQFMTGPYRVLGQPTVALATIREALALWRQLGRRGLVAQAYLSIGAIYADLGELQKAFDYTHRALTLSGEVENPRWAGNALSHLGYLHSLSGEERRAIERYEQVLRIWRSEGLVDKQIGVLIRLGWLHESLGQPEHSLAFYDEAFSLSEASNRWRFRHKTDLLFGKARILASLGKPLQAEEYVRQAVAGWRRRDNTEASDYHAAERLHFRPAEVDERLGKEEAALAHYQKALALFQEADAPRYSMDTLFRIARLQARLGRLELALTSIEQATEGLESRRNEIRGDRFRALFLASQHDYYELWVDLLMRLHQRQPWAGYAADALQVHERSRARSFLEALSETRRTARPNIDPELLEDEARLSARLSNNVVAEARAAGSSVDRTGIELTDLLSELGEIRARIRAQSLQGGELMTASPLTVSQIREQVLDETTLLLEYALGEERSYLWAVTTTSIESFELPSRARIEALGRRYYELLTARGRRLEFETHKARRQRKEQADAAYPSVAAELSEMLLAPVASRLRGRRLLVVGEGILEFLPFSALPIPGQPDRPLVLEHEVVGMTSASALGAMRRKAGVPSRHKTLAMVADPLLGNEKQGVWRWLFGLAGRGGGSTRGDDLLWADPLLRSLRMVGLADLGPLPGAREEAEAILSLVAEDERLGALGSEASRTMVLSGALRPYRIVHFATHALLNSRHPDISGIVLSLVDEQGVPQDGFLRLHDVYNLELQADLVVLSACQTALGEQIRGEGLVGLTRGFMYAGAAAVVASLWSPEDAATAKLMKLFYGEMLGKGLAPAAALRAAQIELLRDEAWQAPYSWAGFVLQGDWQRHPRVPRH